MQSMTTGKILKMVLLGLTARIRASTFLVKCLFIVKSHS